MPRERCIRCASRVGWIGLFVNSLLLVVKLYVGVRTDSRALMADALYSTVDVVSALLVIGSLNVSRKGADADHPYGRGKVEFLAIVGVSVGIAAFAVILLQRTISAWMHGGHHKVSPMAAVAAGIAVVACFVVWRYAECVGRKLDSPVILTHAEHNKSDALSSAAVLLSITLSWAGLSVLDPIIAVLEVIDVIIASAILLRHGIDGLLDASVAANQTQSIAQVVQRVPGVVQVDDVRARKVGSVMWVEICVRVAAQERMSAVGGIRSRIRAAIAAHIKQVVNVMVEIAPAISVAQSIGSTATERKPWFRTS